MRTSPGSSQLGDSEASCGLRDFQSISIDSFLKNPSESFVIVVLKEEGILQLKSTGQTRIALRHHRLQLLAISQHHHYSVLPGEALDLLDEGVDYGLSIGLIRPAHSAAVGLVESIGLIDDQHTAVSLFQDALGDLLGLPQGRADEIRGIPENDFSLGEQTEIRENSSE
jgi:hypothetical protein